MAHAPRTPARTQRLIAVAATALLGVTTAMAIGRVFVGAATSYRLVAAALASAAIACAMERRNLLLATIVSAIALLVVIGLLIFPATTWHGLPTVDTLHAIGRAARLVGQEARRQVAPTVPLSPLVLAALAATWAAIFSAHALAFRAGSPLLALLPPIALVGFADTVLEEFIRPVYGLMFLAAALVVVFADGLRRLQGWGPVWAGPGKQARLSSAAARGARGVVFATMGLALIAPVILPGFGSKAVLDLSSAAGDSVRVDPLVSVANDLQQDEERAVFTVRTSGPTYYRFAALPDFNGSQWSQDPTPFTTALPPDPSITTPLLFPEVAASAETVTQTIEMRTDLNQNWLPVAYPPRSVQLDAETTWDAESGAVGIDGLDEGTQYTVTALKVQPTPEELRASATPSAAQSPRYVAVDPSVDPEVANIADRLTQGAATDYDKVMAVQDYLRNSGTFLYDTEVPKRDDSGALLDFLTVSQAGFCQQFATAMAVLLREVGIPARVAVGFTSGTQSVDDSESWTVTNHDAHAWVEVLFNGYGWLAFEPTPSRVNPVASVYTNSRTPTCTTTKCRGATRGPTDTGATAGANPRGGNPAERNIKGTSVGVLAPTQAVAPASGLGARRWLLIAGALALLAFLLLPVVRALQRRRRLARAAGRPRQLILATYDVFTERAAELGFARGEGETIEEYRRRVSASGLLRDGDLDRLSAITASAAYAPRDPEVAEVRAATEAAHTTLKDLERGTPWTSRIRGRYRRER